MRKILSNKSTVFAFSALLAILTASPLFAQAGSKTNTPANVRDVTVGAFTVKVPSDWRSFSTSESDQLRRQYMAQSQQIYRQYSGKPDPARSVNIAAFHIAGDTGTFAIVSFTIPPQSDLVNLLKSQAPEKAKWGIQQGYIQKYLGLVPLDNAQFSGFYIKCVGKSGEVQVSGGLEHKKLKNTLVQLTLICPKTWDEVKATSTLSSVLKTVMLKEKGDSVRSIGGIQKSQVMSKDKGEGEKRQSQTTSVNLSQIVMHPGENKQIVLNENESVTFEFLLPKPGSCRLSLSSESLDVVALNMGVFNAIIKKGQPFVMLVTRNAKNPKPTEKFVNATGKKTTPINVELSEMLPLDK